MSPHAGLILASPVYNRQWGEYHDESSLFLIRDIKTILCSAFFIAGNLLLPQICHLLPQGGIIFLPIYFFTLIAACKYGFSAGLLTAILSPILNTFIFGMPAWEVLPLILIKSGILASTACLFVHFFGKKYLFLALFMTVFSAYFLGIGIENIFTGSSIVIPQNPWVSLPGLGLQIFGGYGLLKLME